MMTGAFSWNVGKLFSELELVTETFSFIYAEANREVTESQTRLVSDSLSVGSRTTSILAARFWRFCSRPRVVASMLPLLLGIHLEVVTVVDYILIAATQSNCLNCRSKVAWQQCTWYNYCARDKCRCTYIYYQTRKPLSNLRTSRLCVKCAAGW